MRYKLNNQSGVIRSDGKNIPADGNNLDYRQYLEWVMDGNSPDPADPEPVREITLSPPQQIILADGLDVASVTMNGQPSTLIEYTINGEAQKLTLSESGKDVLELICDTPNTTLLVQAGSAKAVIFAVEVPS